MAPPPASRASCELHNVYIPIGDEDVPVNKATSFNGSLAQFMHPSGLVTAESPKSLTCPSKQNSTAIDTAPPTKTTRSRSATASPMSMKTQRNMSMPFKSTINSSTRTTRSRSRSSSTIAPSPSPSPAIQSPNRRKRRPICPSDTPPASSSLLRDTIPPNLILLLVGVNPGLMTGTTGFAYSHPSNRFWHLLHSSGITSIRHPPSDCYKLPELYSVGNTNIVVRPTRDASMLTKAEMNEGVPILEAKIAAQRPEAVCLVGKSIWETVWRVRHGRAIRKEEFTYGWQRESENMGCLPGVWRGAPVFVATTTSGLAASMSIAEKEAVWAELGEWVVKRREVRAKEIEVIAT
ncbi:hypothetical protein N7454_010379 [Penicillium verhagenii]|nr:hypothetical protein N7454_010379 [Penicillium verhagenii]